jgi:hypothetical protein
MNNTDDYRPLGSSPDLLHALIDGETLESVYGDTVTYEPNDTINLSPFVYTSNGKREQLREGFHLPFRIRRDPPKPSDHDRILGILVQPGCVVRVDSGSPWAMYGPSTINTHILNAEYATMDRDGRIIDGPHSFREVIR